MDLNKFFTHKVDNDEGIHTITIVGSKGQGKTRLLMAMAILDDKPLKLVWDTVGIMDKMESVRVSGKDLRGNYKHVEKNLMAIIPLTIQKKIPLVFDLSGLLKTELIEFSENVCQFLMLNKVNCGLYIDEVGDYIPQNHMGYSERLEQLVRVGRNYNISPVVMVTQRIQKPSKDCLALSDVYVTFKFSYILDRKYLLAMWGKGDNLEIDNA